ncbi:MAG TPA: MOSC domain-containing protein [bacterium]|nr:MOSC domain-containing protein [bacterium]
MKLKLEAICISPQRGMIKQEVEEAEVVPLGIEGDSHSGEWSRQITILAQESIDKFNSEHGTCFKTGEFACNLVVSGLDVSKVALFDRFRFNDVLLEVTMIGKEPHPYNSPVYEKTGTNIMFTEGIFCRVITPGEIKKGYLGSFIEMPFKIKVITLSDRASSGEYEDRSGPEIENILEEHFKNSRFHPHIEKIIIADEAELLRNRLVEAKEEKYAAVFTTGGTGIGPRDITADTVIEECDKLISGIMDMIRIKYGSEKPNVLLSRSVAGTMDETLVYTLPGSPEAVTEYMIEILKSFEHAYQMLKGCGH